MRVISEEADIPDWISRHTLLKPEYLKPPENCRVYFRCRNEGVTLSLCEIPRFVADDVRQAMLAESHTGIVVYIGVGFILLAFTGAFSWGVCVIEQDGDDESLG